MSYHVLTTALLSCVAAAAATVPQTPTFNQDVLPILEKRCIGCHRAGEVGPMSLVTYKDARPWAAAIREAVVTRAMPPWPAAGPIGHFSNDWRLTDSEIDLIRRWAEAHAPEGAAPANAVVHAAAEWKLGPPDLLLHMPTEVRLPGNGTDVWKYMFLDKTFEEDTWIRGLEIKPGNRKVVHHANVNLFTPDGKQAVDWDSVPEVMDAPQNKAGKIAGLRSEGIHVGLPGRFWFETVSGSAMLIPKGSRLRINIHYAPVKTVETDSTVVGLYLAKGHVEKRWKDLHCKITDFLIPANSSGHPVTGTKKVTQPITVYQVGAHMHLRGQSYRIWADLPDGKSIELLNVPKFQFDWQLMYTLAAPIHLPTGTVVHYVATYNNTRTNPLVLRYDTADRDVGNGERTVDEMMGGYVMYTADDENLNLSLDPKGRPLQVARK